MGCSPIKAVRELGSERRETVDTAVYKSGRMLETPSIPRYSPLVSGSDNASGADNQQERLDSRIAGWLFRILRDCMPDRAREGPEDTVRAAWRHAESGRNDLTLRRPSGVTNLSVPIRHGRWELERSRL